MTEEERLRALYQGALGRAERPGDAAPIPIERLEALAASRVRGAEALALLDRVMADPALLREYELLRALHQAGDSSTRREPRHTSRRWLPLAAAAVLLVSVPLTWRAWSERAGTEDPLTVRGAGTGVALLTPANDATVELPVRLAWQPVADALRYRVEILTEAGSVALVVDARDTVVVVDALPADDGSRFRWTVEALTPAGPRRSALAAFSVRAP